METDSPRFSDAEKLIVLMLCDLYKHLKVEGDVEPEFIEDVIIGGHYWALGWEYPGVFHDHVDSPQVLSEVVDTLEMWSFIESAYKELSQEDKSSIEAEAVPLGKYVSFRGFDGNNESEHLSIARVLIEKLGRFESFKGRDLNSHIPVVDRYRRMLEVFLPILPQLAGRELAASEIITLLNARPA